MTLLQERKARLNVSREKSKKVSSGGNKTRDLSAFHKHIRKAPYENIILET